ncbi:MAG TPA: hypothetical protein VHM24_05550 [Gemmatimonadaceae bacterium]|nr:hypothetical protein [Gemmatimonadaceae bacterium]
MRSYTVAAVAVAMRMPIKWVDNVLSHHNLPGISRKRQGIARKVTMQAVVVLQVALDLVKGTSIPLRRAIELASDLIAVGGSDARVQLSQTISLAVDVDAIGRGVSAKLADAVEVAPRPRRGRPRR